MTRFPYGPPPSLTAAIQNSAVLRAIRGEPAVLKAMQGNATVNQLFEGNPTLNILVRGNPTLDLLTKGNPTLDAVMGRQSVIDALRQPSLVERLNNALVMARAAQMDEAVLTAAATYGDLLRAAAQRPGAAGHGDGHGESAGLLDEAEAAVVAAFDDAGLNGREEVDKAKATAQEDLTAVVAEGLGSIAEEVAVVESAPLPAADLQETNDLIRQMLAGQHTDRALALAALIVAILSLAFQTYTWRFPVVPPAPHQAPARPARIAPATAAPQKLPEPRSRTPGREHHGDGARSAEETQPAGRPLADGGPGQPGH